MAHPGAMFCSFSSWLQFNQYLSDGTGHLSDRYDIRKVAKVVRGNRSDTRPNYYFLSSTSKHIAPFPDDAKHPFFSQFQKLRSGRRYNVPFAMKNVMFTEECDVMFT